MKYSILVLFILISLAACQNQKGYTINGTVHNQKVGTVFMVNLHTEQQDTLDIIDGKFSMKGEAEEPTPFLLYSADVLPAQTIFFAHKGSTNIDFTANEPSTVKIKGCKTQKEYDEFTKMTKPLLAQFDSIQMLAMAGKLEQSEVQNVAMAIQKKYEDANLDFIKKHPSSYVSSLLTYEYLRQKPQMKVREKKELLGKLDKKIQESHFGKKMVELIGADETTAEGKPAPAFSLPDTKGKKVSLSSFKGKYVLVDFWASWCTPCRAENPNIVAAFNKYKNKNFTILGVSLDENKKQWLEAIAKDNLKWQHVSDLGGWNSSVVSLYNIKSIPSNVLLDPQGNIVAKDLRGVDLENQLSNLIK